VELKALTETVSSSVPLLTRGNLTTAMNETEQLLTNHILHLILNNMCSCSCITCFCNHIYTLNSQINVEATQINLMTM